MTKLTRDIQNFFALVLLCFSCEAADFELWTRGAIFADITESSQLFIFAGARWNENASHNHHDYGEVGLILNVDDKWLIIPSYRESFRRDNLMWEQDENPRFTVIRRWDNKIVRFSNRSRFEYRTLNNRILYRNRVLVELTHPCFNKITPYLADEIFLEKTENFTQNRIMGGFHANMNECIECNFSYMFRWKKEQGTWFRNHIILYNLNFYF